MVNIYHWIEHGNIWQQFLLVLALAFALAFVDLMAHVFYHCMHWVGVKALEAASGATRRSANVRPA